MTDCPNGEMRDRLPELLHDRLSPADRAAVEAHVATCAECRAELALLASLRAELRRAPVVDIAAIVRALPAAGTPSGGRRLDWRAAAAIIAIAVGGTSVVIARHEQGARPAAVDVASRPAAVATPGVTAPSAAGTVPAPVETAAAPVPALPTSVPTRVAQAAPRRELAVAGAVSDLSDRELAALLTDIESLDAVPPASADVESTSLAPATAPARGAS